jgi:hypothetical protein
MTEIQNRQNSARHKISVFNVLIIGFCDFDIVCYLSIVICNFSAVFGKANCFYLTQLELTSTFSGQPMDR